MYALCQAIGFNTQPPEGGWHSHLKISKSAIGFQHTAARRRLVAVLVFKSPNVFVSTHSRPKAAGFGRKIERQPKGGFNTQPPEGGWSNGFPSAVTVTSFQHTAARRRLAAGLGIMRTVRRVSTHSRPKAAGQVELADVLPCVVSTHSRPKAAGNRAAADAAKKAEVSTHSRPKAAGMVSW